MARSLLRASQLRDEDVMEEAEHDAWVHVNLVTSGTVNFQDGTISGTGDVYATTFYGDGSQLSGLSAEPSSIYYSSSARATATTNGIQITDGTNTGNLGYHGPAGALTLTNTQHGAGIWMYGEDNAGSNKTLFFADPDGAVRLYHAGAQTLFTKAGGFYFQNGGDQAYISLSTDIYYHNHVHGGRHLLKAEQTDGTNVFTAVLDPDGAAELYYTGSKVMETISDGIQVNDILEPTRFTEIKQDTDVFRITNRQHNGQVRLSLEDSNGSERLMLNAYANGLDTRLGIYAGTGVNVAVFSDNGSEGAMNLIRGSAAGTSGATLGINSNSKVFSIRNNYDTGHVNIQGQNTASEDTTLFNADPDGAAELYYAGVKTFSTVSNGSILYNPSDNNNYLHTVVGATDVQIIMNTQGSDLFVSGQKTGGGTANLFSCDPDGSMTIYYAGASAARTFGGGAGIGYGMLCGELASYTGTNYGNDSGNGIIYNWDHGGVFRIICENSVGASKDIFKGDPDGAVELYYAGAKKFETTASGINVIDTITQNGERLYTQSEVDALLTTLSGALQSQIDALLAI